jgi:hypothetical protein
VGGSTSSVAVAAVLAPDALGRDRGEGFRKCCEESPSPQAAREMPGQKIPPPVAAQMMIRMALMSR